MKISFKPFTKEDYYCFEEWEIESYANALIKSKTESREDALCVSAEELEELLPDGIDTPDNVFLNASNGENNVGFLWYSIKSENEIFLSEFFVYEQFRAKGVEEAMLHELEVYSKAELISLHVFDFDKSSIKLYEKSGYEVYAHMPPASTYMKKEVF